MVDTGYYKNRPRPTSAPQGCPVDHTFSPFEENYRKDPYAELEKRRNGSPVFYSEELGYLVLTRMEDVSEVFRKPEIFSSENVQHPVTPICDAAKSILATDDYDPMPVLSNGTPPDHTRVRKHAQAGFSGRRIRILEPYVRRRCETLIDAMIAKGSPANFVKSVAHPLPGETIFRFIGFPEEDDQKLKEWTANRLAFTWGKSSDDEQVEIAENMLAYWRYCAAFVKRRLADPADDFTSELLAVHKSHPDDLAFKEIESVVYGLSFAGHEIVTNLLSNCLINLLSNRSQWEEIRDHPEMIPKAVDEVLRIDSPQTSWRRVAVVDTEIAGYKIPAGTEIFLSLAWANHDEELFENPKSFDIFRKNAGAHISFGRGIHFCLGNRLAILEATVALETLVERLPSLMLVEEQTFSFYPNFTFRGPAELWLTWSG
ncbi:MAG: cytochrome P450 [Alphaproteobacteria bacterium]|nr:cytochrome P450 [Alphaproteobacteria bacterium]